MVNITPPSSNSGTPARPVSPAAEAATMDVDSVPQSPSAHAATPGAATPAEASSRGSPIPAAMLAQKGSDTEEDEDVTAAEARPVQAATAAVKNSGGGMFDASTTRQADVDKGSRGKNRDMFDGEIVDRWNQEFGDLFAVPGPAPGAQPAAAATRSS